jgi:hypothetical protein
MIRQGAGMTHDIFLSYSHADEKLARQLIALARERGLSFWYDVLIVEGDWREKIVEAMRQSSIVVVLFSGETNKSKQLKKELAIADRLDKPVIPVLLEDVAPEGNYLYELASKNWIVLHPEPSRRLPELLEKLSAVVEGMQHVAVLETDPKMAALAPVRYSPGRKSLRRFLIDAMPFLQIDRVLIPVVLLGCILAGGFIVAYGEGVVEKADPAGEQMALWTQFGLWLAFFAYFVIFGYRNGGRNRPFFRTVVGYLEFAAIELICAVPMGAFSPISSTETRDEIFRIIVTCTILFVVIGAVLGLIIQTLVRGVRALRLFRANTQAG